MSLLPRRSKWKYYLMWLVIHTIGAMPLNWRYAISRFASDRIYDWRRSIRDNVRSNMRHVLGPGATEEEIDRLGRACARNTGRYYADIVGLLGMDTKTFYERELDMRGLEYIREAQSRGQGVVLASAHYANPEFAAQALAGIGLHVFALVEPLHPPELDRLMRGLRIKHGHRYEPVSFRAIKEAMTWLRNGGILCILIDRDIQKRGIELELCGANAKFPTGAADLALRTNSILLPGWVYRTDGFKIRADIGPPMELIRSGNHDEDVRVNSQRLLDLFEIALRKDPGQWSVLEKIWPD
ncbi:MAG: lysophospholipid acyltransferase family protein [Chloroflexi bacterium]|nr:lysophospholipid acyltransferase family protein [Chloroflexota bacterium]